MKYDQENGYLFLFFSNLHFHDDIRHSNLYQPHKLGHLKIMAGIPLKYESFGIYHPSNALLCYYLVLRSFSLKMTFFFTTIFITPLPSGCCSLSNRTPLFWMWSSKQKTKLRIYALCRPNKAIVIKNNPKERNIDEEKLIKGCFLE